jgi:hypothetical protein
VDWARRSSDKPVGFLQEPGGEARDLLVHRVFPSLRDFLYLVSTLSGQLEAEWAFLEAVGGSIVKAEGWGDGEPRFDIVKDILDVKVLNIDKSILPPSKPLTQVDFEFVRDCLQNFRPYWELWYWARRTAHTAFHQDDRDLGVAALTLETAFEVAVAKTQGWADDDQYSPGKHLANVRSDVPADELASLAMTRHRIVHRGRLEYVEVRTSPGDVWGDVLKQARTAPGVTLTRDHCLAFCETVRKAIPWLEANPRVIAN